MTALRRLALLTAISTYLLIVVGAIVRSTGSGLGCPDWPLCHGQFLPPPEIQKAWIESSHRWVAALVSTFMLAMVAAAWVWGRHIRHIVIPATAVPIILAAQIMLGAWVVWLETPALVVMIHLSFAFVIMAFVLWVNIAARVAANGGLAAAGDGPADGPRPSRESLAGYWRLALLLTAVTYLLLVVGGLTRALGAGWVCSGFPLCNGQLAPFGSSGLVDLHLTHRLLGFLVAALIFWTAWKTTRTPGLPPAMKRVVYSLVVIVLAQITIGAVAVVVGPALVLQSIQNGIASGVPVSASASGSPVAAPLWIIQTLHVAGASAVWSMVVVLLSMTWQVRRPELVGPVMAADELAAATPSTATSPREAVRAYFALTKPRVIVLLLITTLAAMLMAHRGLPPLGIILFTLLGGALAAGGAGAINHYLDRDVDELMGRTAARPIPSGVVPPLNGLFFGICLGIISFTFMVAFVNLLSAGLTLFALLFYVFVYTRWLKRWTPLNIVIGGAAGAIPPVVGIAAVTNEVNWLAIWLFTIIFVWTPPHFWALSLLMQREYAAAGIPMLPIVRGEEETRRQILWYSLAMVALTLVVWTLGFLGAIYVVAAAGLGGLFIWYAVRLWREASALAARRLFLFSMLYLALLFVAMVVDRQVLL
jgi:protoheme IX farnesyltransferase